MLRLINKKFKKAQSLSEYAVLLTVIALVFVASQLLVQRFIQSAVKYTADQIAFQRDAADEQDPNKGHLVSQKTRIIRRSSDGPEPDKLTYIVKEDSTGIERTYKQEDLMLNDEEWNRSSYILDVQEKE